MGYRTALTERIAQSYAAGHNDGSEHDRAMAYDAALATMGVSILEHKARVRAAGGYQPRGPEKLESR